MFHGPFGAVENEKNHDIEDGNGTSCDKRYLGSQKV